ncbi:unnamed protein product [Thlaspi arvense]|uniref:Defensin-like domain-containing protein n=1 Tax=Thlaspi arvense TaxID=13288 RepID=A0AAU9S518_THLAR|nr:unnamed protein product [Thlaspi arvense]
MFSIGLIQKTINTMDTTKNLLILFLIVILVPSFSNHNLSALGKEKISFDNCKDLCTMLYDWRPCFVDCISAGFDDAKCVSPSPGDPPRCCCQRNHVVKSNTNSTLSP